MAKNPLALFQVENGEQPTQSLAFQQNFQTALLLSLLERNLLTQRQFEQCQDQIKRKKRFENDSRRHTVQK